jgi:hypothetical protein
MPPTPPSEVFEDTDDLPTGRKARKPAPHVLAALEDSAKRKVGKVHTASEDAINALRKDLTSAEVRKKYEITTETERLANGMHKLKFAAKHKPKPAKPESATG